jgi:hypothetical protein
MPIARLICWTDASLQADCFGAVDPLDSLPSFVAQEDGGVDVHCAAGGDGC